MCCGRTACLEQPPLVWRQGLDRPAGEDKVPDYLDWDLWLGPAAVRPYKQGVYHTFNRRGWYDFGTGAPGHGLSYGQHALVRSVWVIPLVVECEVASRVPSETFPLTSRLRFEFPEREGLPPLKFWWYDGNPDAKNSIYSKLGFINPLRPDANVIREIIATHKTLPSSGCLSSATRGNFSPRTMAGSKFQSCSTTRRCIKTGKLMRPARLCRKPSRVHPVTTRNGSWLYDGHRDDYHGAQKYA